MQEAGEQGLTPESLMIITTAASALRKWRNGAG